MKKIKNRPAFKDEFVPLQFKICSINERIESWKEGKIVETSLSDHLKSDHLVLYSLSTDNGFLK